MPDVIVTLGDFTFYEFEVPDRIPFGGEQRLSVKKLIGGVRVIDALGRDPIPLEWSGYFLDSALIGTSPLNRALQLKQLHEAGQPLTLSWSQMFYQVVIRGFYPVFERQNVIPYRIVCEVLEDLTVAPAPDAGADADDLINGDMNTVNSIVPNIADSTLTSLTGTLDTAIGAVSSFATAAQSALNSVLQPLNAVRSRVQVLMASVDNTLINVTTVGGILPGNALSKNVAKFTAQLNAGLQQPQLVNLMGVLGRMGTNLGQINSSTRAITVSGGHLFDIAAKEYGDASGWTAIAQANGLTDPMLTGITTLIIPPFNNNTGGVLNA